MTLSWETNWSWSSASHSGRSRPGETMTDHLFPLLPVSPTPAWPSATHPQTYLLWFPSLLCFFSPIYCTLSRIRRWGGQIFCWPTKKKKHLLFFSSISLDQPVPVLNSLPFSTATVYDPGWSWCCILYHNFNRKFDCISLPVILKHCYPPPIYRSALLLHRDVGP